MFPVEVEDVRRHGIAENGGLGQRDGVFGAQSVEEDVKGHEKPSTANAAAGAQCSAHESNDRRDYVRPREGVEQIFVDAVSNFDRLPHGVQRELRLHFASHFVQSLEDATALDAVRAAVVGLRAAVGALAATRHTNSVVAKAETNETRGTSQYEDPILPVPAFPSKDCRQVQF